MKYLAFLLIFASAGYAAGQSPSGLLAPNRYIDWTHAGAGAIPARTTICQTLGTAGQASTYAQSVTAAQIVAALQACAGTNQTVYLNPGTYTMTTTLFGPGTGGAAPSSVTLRGSGANQTILNWTAMTNTCLGIGLTGLCVYNGDSGTAEYSANVLNWTAGYSQGTTTITLGSAVTGNLSNLHVGSLLQLNQCDTGLSGAGCTGTNTDNGNFYVCGTPPPASGTALCTWGGNSNAWPNRAQTQTVTVTGISGSTITISPGLYLPNWSSSKSPYAVFSSSAPVTGFGLENIQLNTQSMGDNEAMLQFEWTTNSWVKNVAFVNSSTYGAASRTHITMASGVGNTVRDSYFYGSSPGSSAYGVDLSWGETHSLVENNIFQHMATGTILETGVGNVFGYNYAVDNFYVNGDGNWQQCDGFHHNEGDAFDLWEGHEGTCIENDDFHGTSFGITVFRSYLSGHDPATQCPGGGTGCGTLTKLQNTAAIIDQVGARYENVVLSVLGDGIYANTYQNAGSAGSPNSCPSYPWTVLYSLNFANSNQLPFSAACIGSAYTLDNDNLVSSSLVRWGNYDTVNGAVRTNSGETGSSASTYPGLASPSTSWSSYPSLYLSSKPSFMGSLPWPGIGPEITGGNISGVSGHANHNAAGTCFYGPMGGVNTGASGVLNFDAYTVCNYGTGGTPQAAAPAFSPTSPYSGAATTVTLSSSTPSPTITYCQDTINTCTPSTVGTSVSFSSTGYIRAFTTATGYTQSPTSSWQGTISTPTLAAPTFSPNGAVDAVTAPYFLPASFSLGVTPSGPAGATLCYKFGSAPGAATPGTCDGGSTTYTSGTIAVTANQNLQMLATKAANTNSAVTSVFYNQRNAVLDSTCSFNGGNLAITTGSCTLSPNPTAGDGLTCGYAIGNNTSIGTISDNVGGAYLPANASYYGTSTFAASGRVYRTGLPGGSTTVTLNLSGSAQYTGFGCEAYKPASAGAFTLDTTFTQSSPYPNATTGNSSSPTVSSITPTNANEIVYGQVLNATYTINPTAGSGFTIVNPLPGSPLLYPEYQIQTTAAATTLPFSLSATDQWQEQPAAFYFSSPSAPPPTVIQGVTAIGVQFK